MPSALRIITSADVRKPGIPSTLRIITSKDLRKSGMPSTLRIITSGEVRKPCSADDQVLSMEIFCFFVGSDQNQ